MRLLLLFCFLNYFSKAQTKYTDTSSAICDCNTPKTIIVNNSKLIKHIKAPNCGGNNGIKASNKNKGFAFEKEHNTNWYKLIFKVGGNLCFTIKPFKKDDDYDFMLFKEVPNFCDSLNVNKAKAIRANISRDKEDINGYTGLNSSSTKEFVKQGVGDAYCKSVPVKNNEVYYLVLDNVYDKGEGFDLELFFETQVNITGQILDEDNNPIKAEVSLNNSAGNQIAKVFSDSITGKYQFNLGVKDNQPYTLNYFKDNSFFYTRTFKSNDTVLLKPLNQVLPKLKKGAKYSVGSVNFYGGEDQYLPASLPAIKNLLRLMKKNENLSIVIIGHTNGCGSNSAPPSKFIVNGNELMNKGVGVERVIKATKSDSARTLKLSVDRASKIKTYLVEHKISTTRITTLGKGCKEMLYPFEKMDYDIPDWQQEANRRVEIMVKE